MSSPPTIQLYPQPANTQEGGKGAFQQWTVSAQNCSYATGFLSCQIQSNMNQQDLFMPNVSIRRIPVPITLPKRQRSRAAIPRPYLDNFLSYPLDAILAQKPQGFPALSSTANACVNNFLGLQNLSCQLEGTTYTGLRCQYGNLAAPLSSYQDALGAPNVAAKCGGATVKQLNAELTYATAIRNLFEQFTVLNNQLFINLGDVVPKLIADASLTVTEPATANSAGFFEGIIFAGLSAFGASLGVIPGVGGIIGSAIGAYSNLIHSALTSAAKNSQTQGNNLEQNFTVAISEVYQRLGQDFNTVISTSGQQEETLLADWGMMQAVYPLTQAGGELSWTPETNATLVQQLTPGFISQFMSILLGSKFALFQNNYSNTFSFSQATIPSYDQWAQYVNVSNAGGSTSLCLDQYDGGVNGLTNCNAGSGLVLYHEYWLQETDYSLNYPTQAAINDLIGNGVSLHDFFTLNNGFVSFPSQDDTSTCPVPPGKDHQAMCV